MQIFFLTPIWSVLLCFGLWPILQTIAAWICLLIPIRFFAPDRFIFRSHAWEKEGKIYSTIFRVDRWKAKLPDGAAVRKNGYKKKNLENFTEENLQLFLVESCRAEMSHWLAIIPFWVFGFFTPAYVIFFMFLYAVGINTPCIIAQRYNRPRIIRVLAKRAGK
jgi:glycosyl-4,4'-diaponeurosporenoate acyltransferase